MFGRHLVTPHQAAILEERARFMRLCPTRSEEWLWRRLSGSKTGSAFRRQLVIGPFIVGFACTKVRLAVEVDGSFHLGRVRRPGRRRRHHHPCMRHVSAASASNAPIRPAERHRSLARE